MIRTFFQIYSLRLALSLCLFITFTGMVAAQAVPRVFPDNSADTRKGTSAQETVKRLDVESDRIITLRAQIKKDWEALQQLGLAAALAEDKAAEDEMYQMEDQADQLRATLQKLKSFPPEERDTAAIEAAEKKLNDLSKQLVLARNRYDIAVKELAAKRQQANLLNETIARNQLEHETLTGGRVPLRKPAAGSGVAGAEPSAGVVVGGEEEKPGIGDPQTQQSEPPATGGETSQPAPPIVQPSTTALPVAPAATPAPTVSAAAMLSGGAIRPEAAPVSTDPSATPTPTPDALFGTEILGPKKDRTPSRALQEASLQASEREDELMAAREAVATLEINLESAQTEKELVLQQMSLVRQSLKNETETERTLVQQIEEARASGADADELSTLTERLKSTRARTEAAQQRMTTYETELNRVQRDIDQLDKNLSQKRKLLDTADKALQRAKRQEAWTRSWLHPSNLIAWSIDSGVKILVTLFLAWFFNWLINLSRNKAMFYVARRAAGTATERLARARTLVQVIANVLVVLVHVLAILIILTNVGIPMGPLLGGAAIGGLAIAFGAQNLIRDFFTGFVILVENQYSIGDVVKIGENSGVVEKITLRMTVLRDLAGAVHFVPNGTITSVTNMSYGWARAVFEVGVAYKESVDQVVQVIKDIGNEMRNDPQYSDMILEDLTMLGLDAMTESSIVVKFFVKTRPLKQWEVKREFLRRVKIRFDAEGIEIPYTQRTVHHRFDGETSSPQSPRELIERGGFGKVDDAEIEVLVKKAETQRPDHQSLTKEMPDNN